MSANKKQNKCGICEKTIIGNIYKLRSHLHTHNAVKPKFQCSHCEKKYYRRDVFNIHVKTHLGEVPKKKIHICDYCERGFVNKRNLIVHLTIHDDVPILNKFKCIACPATYCEKRLLEFHIRKMHYNLQETKPNVAKKMLNETWIEPVKKTDIYVEMTKVNNNVIAIKKCPLKTEKHDIKNKTQKSNLKDYIKSVFANNSQTHYSKAICDYCNKEMLKKSLISHIQERHLNIRKFKCMECNLGFKRHYQLVNHVCGITRIKNY